MDTNDNTTEQNVLEDPIQSQTPGNTICESTDLTEVSANETDENVMPPTPPEAPPFEYTSEWLKANTQIHGWLSFFMFAIIVGGLLSAIFPIVTFKSEDYAGNFFLGASDIVLGSLMLAVAVYTVYLFVQRKPNAFFWAMTYVLLVFITNILVLLLGATEEGSLFQSEQRVMRSIGWGVIWFLYLIFSDQVKEIIPKAFRKVTKTDWLLLAVVVLLPILLWVIGYAQITSIVKSRENQKTELLNIPLADNERTDGRVIFTIPNGFDCESQIVDVEGVEMTLFTINSMGIDFAACNLCADYDTDNSKSNFEDYWKNWKDDSYFGMQTVDEGQKMINGNKCRFRISKCRVYSEALGYKYDVYWRFYLLFDKETGKVLVASSYDYNTSIKYVDELLNSIRFK